MMRNKIIQYVSAVLLAAVFALSITPKQVLHDLISNHKHDTSSKVFGDNQRIERWSFICDVDENVASSPFLWSVREIQISTPAHLNIFNPASVSGHELVNFHFVQLRGPPSALA